MRYFCTLFDSNYLVKGLAMLRSLKLRCGAAYVYVLCMDKLTRQILEQLNLADVKCLSLEDVEDDALLAVKPGRSVAEYCWTLSPCLPWYLLTAHPEIQEIVYLDADLYFYSSVDPLFEEIGKNSISIIEHRFPDIFKSMEINGRFCVEWVGFKRDDQGLACLKHWRKQCLEWCFHRLEAGRMGDQKYLDQWPSTYSSLCILQHPGAGIAPWNYSGHVYENDSRGRILIDRQPLIFYHFHQFQLLTNGKFDRLSAAYRAQGKEPEMVYAVYEAAIRSSLAEVRTVVPQFSGGFRPIYKLKAQRWIQAALPLKVKSALKKIIKAV